MMSFIFKVALAATVSAEIAVDDQDGGLSLLQLRAHKTSVAGYETEAEDQNPDNMCRSGIRVFNICYDRRCGSTGQRPGGRNCAALPGGANACCRSRITRTCTGPNMERCRCVGAGMGGNMGGNMGRGNMGM